MVRRWLLVMFSMYYDDASMQDLAKAKGRGQRCVRALFREVGLPLAPTKATDLNDEADFSGLCHNVKSTLQEGSI
eukprot:5201714-Heterocapsa_arctica.AAC.1